MPVHAILQYTVADGAVDAVADAARRFADEASKRETSTRRHEVFRVEGSSTLLHLMSFEDALAAEDHRSAEHTRTFTAEIADHLEGEPELLEIERLGGFSGR